MVVGESAADGLHNAAMTTVDKYYIRSTRSGRKLYSRLHYNGSNNFFIAKCKKISQFRKKGSEMKPDPYCFGNIQKFYSR